MVHGNFSFHFGGDCYPSKSGFEDLNQRPMQPYYHRYSLTLPQVQYGPNSTDFWGSSQSSSMSVSASATPTTPLFQNKIPEVEEEPSGMDAVFVFVFAVVTSSPSITIFVFFNQKGPVLESVHLIHTTKK